MVLIESGASQIELQGGYGGGGFIGTVGLAFNNFFYEKYKKTERLMEATKQWVIFKHLQLDFKYSTFYSTISFHLLNHGLVEDNQFNFLFLYLQQNNIDMIISLEEQTKASLLKLPDLMLD